MTSGHAVDVSGFWRDGYTIVPSVYTPEEIAELRAGAIASRHRGPGDLLSNPLLRRVLLDRRLMQIARTILDRDDIVYYGDSSFTIKPGTFGYHKDNADRDDPNAPDWQGRYTQLRFGIYCQDHTRHSGGLNVRRGSHNHVSTKQGKTVYLRTAVGDVGVWSLRTSHSGGGVLLRFPSWHYPDPGHGKRYPKFLLAPRHGERVSIFAALGADDHHLARYVEYVKSRTYMANSLRSSVYDDEVLRAAEAIGLKIWDVPREVAGDESIGRNVDWAPIPY